MTVADVAVLPPGELATETGERRRWTGSMLLVVGLHAIPAIVAAWWLGPTLVQTPVQPAVLIDMAPAAPPVLPSEQPPGPKQVEAQTQPKVEREVVKTPVVPNAAVSIPVHPPEPPREVARQAAPVTTAPPSRPVPPAPVSSSAAPTWQGLLLAQLNQFKRYPREAQGRRQQGVPYIRFVMNRDGRVLSSTLERRSGYPALDAEAVALPKRAQPLPKPPPEVGGSAIELVVPVEFFLR